jgi:hypothetical protein
MLVAVLDVAEPARCSKFEDVPDSRSTSHSYLNLFRRALRLCFARR